MEEDKAGQGGPIHLLILKLPLDLLLTMSWPLLENCRGRSAQESKGDAECCRKGIWYERP